MSSTSKTSESIADALRMDLGKMPPQCIDIERAILSAMMVSKDAAIKMAMKLKTEYFYKETHAKIFQVMKDMILKKYHNPDLLTITNKFKELGKLEEVGGPIYLTELYNEVSTAHNVDIHAAVLFDHYSRRKIIIDCHKSIDRSYQMEDPVDIAEDLSKELNDLFDLINTSKNPFKVAVEHTLSDIIDKRSGIKTQIFTGEARIDRHIAYRPGWTVLVAGSEGVGKTKYITYTIRSMLDNPMNDIGVLWITMEDDRMHVVRGFISMDVKLDSKQLQSMDPDYKLTDEDLESVTKSTKNFENYDVEFIDRQTSMVQIISQARRFCDERPHKNNIVVIDNLGLIQADDVKYGIERDDYLMSKIKGIADETKALVFIIHHFTKEADSNIRDVEGYRPRKEYVKGSSRLLDYVQQALLINYPKKHSDLIFAETNRGVIMPKIEGRLNWETFRDVIVPINNKGDSFSNQVKGLQKETWNVLYNAVKHKTDYLGNKLTAPFILQKYIDYLNDFESLHGKKTGKYKKEKRSLYTFIVKEEYNQDYSPEKDSKRRYLYGDKPYLQKDIEKLFLVETAKNRDGVISDEDTIFRYLIDISYNIFKPV